MAAKYGDDHYGWTCHPPVGASGCSLWNNICKGADLFFRFVKFKVNKGDRVSFWHDRWCERVCLRTLFPGCYVIAGNKRGTVADHMIRSKSLCSWNIQPRRNLNDWEIEEMGRLLNLLESYVLGERDLTDEMLSLDEERFLC